MNRCDNTQSPPPHKAIQILAPGRLLPALLVVCLAFWAGVRAEAMASGAGHVLHVCLTGAADYTSIQSALDAAATGDTIIVQPGVYRESIRFNGKDVTLTSTDPDNDAVVAATIIQSDMIYATVYFSGDESADCLLTGFVITRGGEAGVVGKGWGRDASASRATLRRNIIAGNGGTRAGGVYGMAGLIENCAITGNVGEYGGALVRCDGVIRHCLVAGNAAENGPAGLVSCHGVQENLTIVDNIGQQSCCDPWTGAGLSANQATVHNTLIWGNRIGWEENQIHGQIELIGSLVEGDDTPGVLEPTYVDKEGGDLRLVDWDGVGAEDFVQAEAKWVWFPTSEMNSWARYWAKERAREGGSATPPPPTPTPTPWHLVDSDGDKFADWYEIEVGTDPDDATSFPVLGDVDGNGVTNNLDSVLLLEFLMAGEAAELAHPDRGDVNLDGQINNLDAAILMQWALGQIPVLPWITAAD